MGNCPTPDSFPAQTRPWSTAAVCDAASRLGHTPVILRGLRAVDPAMRVRGRLRHAVHDEGVVDIFAALDRAEPGDVLLVDDARRTDRACVGDLVALEARAAGVAGLLVWGSHRDTADLLEIALPVFSLGTCPRGPHPADARPERLDPPPGRPGDMVLADADGVVLLPAQVADEVLDLAAGIIGQEGRQADAVREGVSLRAQLDWQGYLEHKRADDSYTFRAHLAGSGGAVE